MQAEIQMLKSRATQCCKNLQVVSQDSRIEHSLLPALKKRKTNDETDSEEDIKEPDELETDLVQLSEAACGFI